MKNMNKKLLYILKTKNIMINKENKKLIFGIILAALVFLSYQVIASYMTNPVDSSLKYPNPGHYPGEIGPGTFNCSGTGSNCYFKFTDDFGNTGLKIINGTTEIYKGLHVASGYPLVVDSDTYLGNDSSDKTIVKGDLEVSGGIVSLNDIVANYKAKIESYDSNNNDIVDNIELLTAIEDWKAGKTSEKVLNIMLLLWRQSSSISGLPGSIGVDNYNVFASNNDTLYSGYFTGGKGVKIEGDLNVTGGAVVTGSTGASPEGVEVFFRPHISIHGKSSGGLRVINTDGDEDELMLVGSRVYLGALTGPYVKIGDGKIGAELTSGNRLETMGDFKINGDLEVSGNILHNNNPYVECQGVLAGNDNNWMTDDYYTGEQVCDHLGDDTKWACEQVYYYDVGNDIWILQNCSQTLYKSYWAFGAHDVVGNEVGAAIACCR